MFWKVWERHYDIGILITRVGLGLGFLVYHGWGKLTGGPEAWTNYGGAMSNLGINFGHTFFGFMAAFAEGIGGLCIALGLFYQPMLALLASTMGVAGLNHIASGRGNPGNALTFMVVALGMIFTGPGKYSLDAWLARRFGKS